MLKVTPRFRKELPATATETDGVPCVLVTDPKTGTSFTFYEFEYDLAHQLDGQEVDFVIAWAVANYQTALTPEAIEEFGAKLGELGFLETGDTAAGPGALSASGDSADIEWSAPGAETSQFTPDPSMLSAGGAPELPATPADSARTFMGFQGAASGATTAKTSTKATGTTEMANELATELPSDALTELGDSGPTSGVPTAIGGAVSGRLASAGNVSRGFGERRQPPGPGDVVMTPFEDVSMRFRAPPPERQRSSTGLVTALLVLAGLGGGGIYYLYMRQHPKLPEALRLRVVAPQPTAVYRWFATAGTVVDLDARTMSFDTPGKVVEIMPSGTKFSAGDTLGKLQGAAALEAELAKQKSKLAVFQQMRDSMKASGNRANLRDADDKVTSRKKMVDDVQANLTKLLLRAPESGTIVETPLKVGTLVAAKMPVLKWRGRSLHGDFTMDAEDFARAIKLEFCRVEVAGLGTGSGTTPGAQLPGVAAPTSPGGTAPAGADAGATGAAEGRFVDCMLPPPAGPPVGGVPSLLRKFIVTLPTDAGLVTGQQLHLARKRYDGVFALPLSAVQPITDVDATIWVAAPNGKAEQRNITVAESRDEVLVAAGVNVGDEIIVEPPRDLTPGTLVEPIR